MLFGLSDKRRIITLSIARSIESFGISFLIVILPIYISKGDITVAPGLMEILGFEVTMELLIGVALSTAALINSVGQPIGGNLSDRFRRPKLLIIISIVLLSITIPLYVFANTYIQLLGLRVLQGISGALLIPAVALMINEASKDSNRGENFGIYNTLRLIGFGSGPIVAGGLIDLGPYSIFEVSLSGVDAAFGFTFLTSIVALILVVVFVDEIENLDENRSKDDDRSLKEVILSKEFRPVIALSTTTFLLASSIAVFATLENAVIEKFDQTSFMFGLQFSIAVLANTIVQTPIGRLSDRMGRKIFIIIGFIILIPSVVVQGFVATSMQLLLARFIQGVAVAMVFAPSIALVGDLATDERSGLYLSFITGAFSLGIAVGPTISGILFSIGNYTTPFIFSGLVSILGLIMVILYVEDN